MSSTPQPEGKPPQQPAAAPQAPPPGAYYYYPPLPTPRRGFLARFLISILVMVVGGVLLTVILSAVGASLIGDGTPHVQEKFVSGDEAAKDKIVILPIEGVIWDVEDGFIKRAIDAALKDEHVKAVVLRVDSPGGTVTGSDYLYHHLCELAKEKKIVVSMGSMAASGGYYVSMAVGHQPGTIFAERTGMTGSIGVIIPHYSVAEFMKTYGLADDSISSHPLKQMLSPTKAMTPKEKDIIQKLVNDSFEQFKAVVRSGRAEFDKDPKKLDALATGQIFTVDQAVKNGLVDKAGYVEDAIARAVELADLKGQKFKVVRYKQEAGLRSLLVGQESSKSQSLDLKALLEMTTPRAYYLASWLPVLAGAAK